MMQGFGHNPRPRTRPALAATPMWAALTRGSAISRARTARRSDLSSDSQDVLFAVRHAREGDLTGRVVMTASAKAALMSARHAGCERPGSGRPWA